MLGIKFKHIVVFSAFFIASCAALFSVTGISQLFVGATVTAAIMASALELGKLVSVSFLFRYWKQVPKIFRTYMTVGTVVLMLITSIGIYGYLSSAYASAASGISAKQNQTQLYDSQIQTSNQSVTYSTSRLENLQALRIREETRLDSLLAKGKDTYAQELSIRQTENDVRKSQTELTVAMKQRDSLQSLKTNAINSIQTDGKIGTFYYVAQTLGIPLDSVVKWFVLIIIFVFDPLSLSLIVAYNLIVKNESSAAPLITPTPPSQQVAPIAPTVAPGPLPDPIVSERPYYTDPNYDWNNDKRWHSDVRAQTYHSNLGIISRPKS